MSEPPRVIHIKRKLDEETPVPFLQLEGTKRNRSGSDWFYQRKLAASKHAANHPPIQSQQPHDTKPVILTSKPGDELASPSRLRQLSSQVPHATPGHAPEQGSGLQAAQAPGAPSSSQASRPSHKAFEPRRFHMSRSSMSPAIGLAEKAGISKKARYGTAVFVERDTKRTSQKVPAKAAGSKKAIDGNYNARQGTAEPGDVDMTDNTTYKKPGSSKRLAASAAVIESQRRPLPPAVVSSSENMDQISADMNQWVMHEIGLNLASMEQTSVSGNSPPHMKKSPSKLRPKAPAQRFAERHPEIVDEEEVGGDELMTEINDGDDSGYIIDEYELVSAEMIQAAISPDKIGILDFDNEEDVNVFFAAEEDDEDEADDDEDENAENHYTADYPEDEVDSEDEFNRHAYAFRTGNASDEEEFDDMYYSGDDDAGESYMTEAGREKQKDDDLFQASIRRYIRHHGAG